MNQPLFIETIKIKDGVFYNLPLHIARLERTAIHFYGISPSLNLSEDIIPLSLRKGIVKCRITYSSTIESIEFEPYVFKYLSSLTLVEDNDIDYTYKAVDRSRINTLYSCRGKGDDILIVKNGLVTDTSYANVVFENANGLYTPSSYLLGGTKRQFLLENGIVKEMVISKDDVISFSKIYLVNAMIDIEDAVCVSVSTLKTL